MLSSSKSIVMHGGWKSSTEYRIGRAASNQFLLTQPTRSVGKVRIGSTIVLWVLILDLTIYFDFYPTAGVLDKVVSSNKIMGDLCDTQEILFSPEGMD